MTKSCAPNYFRATTPDARTTRMMQDFVTQTGARARNLISMDCAAGRSFSKGFGEWVQAQGGTVQQDLFSALGNTDFGSQISQLSKHAGGRVLTLFMSDGQRSARQRTSETVSLFEHLVKLVRQRGVTALVVEHDVDAVFPRVRHEAPVFDPKSAVHPNQINSLPAESMNFV